MLKTHCKLVHSEQELKDLGSDWGDHPSVKKEEVVIKPAKKIKAD